MNQDIDNQRKRWKGVGDMTEEERIELRKETEARFAELERKVKLRFIEVEPVIAIGIGLKSMLNHDCPSCNLQCLDCCLLPPDTTAVSLLCEECDDRFMCQAYGEALGPPDECPWFVLTECRRISRIRIRWGLMDRIVASGGDLKSWCE